jgi:hypothetical protein
MRESQVEAHFVKTVKNLGGIQRKFRSPGHNNVPDRIAMFEFETIWFVELKAPEKKAEEGQAREHERYRELGFKVAVLDTRAKVEIWAGMIRTLLHHRRRQFEDLHTL